MGVISENNQNMNTKVAISSRNGKIDLLKFVFALFIMMLHYKWNPVILSIGNHSLELATSGFYAVIFFFIVSGALFSITSNKKYDSWKNNISASSIANDSRAFVVRKYVKFIKWYLVAFVLYILNDIVFSGSIKRVAENLFYSVPSVLLLGHTGFDNKTIYPAGYYVGASWYISALMLMFIVFFPIMRTSYDMMTKVIAPALFVICLYINVSVLNTRVVDSRLYPVIPFLLGIIIGSVVSEVDFSKIAENTILKTILCVVELSCYGSVVLYMCIRYKKEMPMSEYPMMFILALGIIITLSKVNYSAFFDKKIFAKLGQLSMILYMLHVPTLLIFENIFNKCGINVSQTLKFFIVAPVALILSIVGLIISEKKKSK